MKRMIVMAACALAAGSVFAQASAPAAASALVSPAERHQARIEERIDYLHKQLQITPAQETQWKSFAGTMREDGETMGKLYEQRIKALPNESALDNVREYAEISQAHADYAKKLAAAFEPLYASLSPEQKKAADATFRDHPGRVPGDHPHPKLRKPRQQQ